MAIDYKKELEKAAKGMILIHEQDMLIKMIARTIVQKVNVSHAGILQHDRDRDAYVLSVSRGPLGLKVPRGFVRMDLDNPLIRFFRKRYDKEVNSEGILVYKEAGRLLEKDIAPELKEILKGALSQLDLFEAEVCISSYFQDELLGLLLLGRKKDGRDFQQEEIDFFIALTSDVAMAIRNARLFQELESELDKKYKLFIHTTIALAAAIDAKDHYTHGHTQRVTALSLELAKKLNQRNNILSEKSLEQLHIAALLHDIGKIGIPESILNKEGCLTEEEEKKMRQHPLVGTTILQPIKELEEAILGVKYHHERYDGSGYPEGLKAYQIPLIASIIAVADTFDAMTTDRPYSRALSKKEAVEEIEQLAGRQFAPEIVTTLSELFSESKI